MRGGPPELIDLAVQGHRLTGDGLHARLDALPLFRAFLAKKHRLAVDAWGADTSAVGPVYAPLTAHIAAEIQEAHQHLYPWPVWTMQDRVGRLARSTLGEYLVQECADHCVGKSEEEIVELAGSFAFESCGHREGLNRILQENASLVALEGQ